MEIIRNERVSDLSKHKRTCLVELRTNDGSILNSNLKGQVYPAETGLVEALQIALEVAAVTSALETAVPTPCTWSSTLIVDVANRFADLAVVEKKQKDPGGLF